MRSDPAFLTNRQGCQFSSGFTDNHILFKHKRLPNHIVIRQPLKDLFLIQFNCRTFCQKAGLPAVWLDEFRPDDKFIAFVQLTAEGLREREPCLPRCRCT